MTGASGKIGSADRPLTPSASGVSLSHDSPPIHPTETPRSPSHTTLPGLPARRRSLSVQRAGETRAQSAGGASAPQTPVAPQSAAASRQPRVAVPAPRSAGSADEITAVQGPRSRPVSPLEAHGDLRIPYIAASEPQTRRSSLLKDYKQATQRPLDLPRALAAVKLRCAAEVYCQKNELARLQPHLPERQTARQRFERLAATNVDTLVADIEAHPERYSRTLLTDLAQHHLITALNIDVDEFKQGIHKAGLYEGLHSVAGRVVTTAASVASAGVSDIAGTGAALEAGKKTVKVLGHQLAPNVVNPLLTGKLRSVTDVKETFKRVGGQPVVAAQIDKSPDMGAIAAAVKQRRQGLRQAIDRFNTARQTPEGDPQALGQMVDAFLSLHDAADRQYKRRIGLNRTQTYSKGWGTAVNAVAAVGTVVTVAVPGPGHIAGPAILAACIPLQWGAGYLDEQRVKHWYNLRANTKWANFLSEDAAKLHFKDLGPEHLSETALRKSFVSQPELQITAVREVYEDALGSLLRQEVTLEREIAQKQSKGVRENKLAPQRVRLQDLRKQIADGKRDAANFESLDAGRWADIPADGTIGQCLDDLKALERANRSARHRKPGEGAQVLQRYAQVFHAGLSSGVALPVVDGLALADGLHVPDAQGHPTTALNEPAQGATLGAAVVGGAVFTAATGEVRMGKAKNKKLLSEKMITAERLEQDAARWTFEAGGKQVDLRNTGAYDRHVHSNWDRSKRLARALPGSVLGGPVGLVNLGRAKNEIRLARATMEEALVALEASGAARIEQQGAEPSRAKNMSARKDRLYDYQAVRDHLGVSAAADPATEPASASSAPNEAPPQQVDGGGDDDEVTARNITPS